MKLYYEIADEANCRASVVEAVLEATRRVGKRALCEQGVFVLPRMARFHIKVMQPRAPMIKKLFGKQVLCKARPGSSSLTSTPIRSFVNEVFLPCMD